MPAQEYLRRILTARVYDVAIESPLERAPRLSERLGNRVLLKREDLTHTGARTAAHLAGTPSALVEAMAGCGRDLGLAFQLSDDLLRAATALLF